MPRYSKLANFARPRGAKDKRPRKRRSNLLDNEYKGARTMELRTRSIANLGRTLNSVGNSVREARLTAKWLGVDPSRRRSNDPMSIIRNARSVSDTGNSILRLGRGLFGMRSLSSMMAEFYRGK
jgi:hypothetical protein